MSLLDKVNMDLLGPLLIVFGFLRFKKYYSFPLKLLKGIRFFISNTTLSQKHLRAPASASDKNQSIIDKKLEEFNLSMMEMDGTIRKGSILHGLLLYDVYETIVYLSVCSVAMHIFSVSFHCFSPTSAYSIWGSIFVALSAILPFRCLIRILLMTGFEAFESRVAVMVALISQVVSAAFLFSSFDVLKLSLDDVLASTSVHCNALLLQISSTAIQPSLPVMTAAVKLVLSLLVALTALGMTIPALRFSQSFNTLLFGAKHEKGATSVQLLLVIDHFLPVLVSATMVIQGFVLNSPSPRADGHFLAAQLAVTALMVAVRLYCLRKHVQSFLDATVKMISVEIAAGNRTEAMTAGIQEKVASRFNYIPAAAVQYISVPLCALGLSLLVHKSAPAGTGVCLDLRTALGMDNAVITAATMATLSYDATSAALAMTSRGEPSLMTGLHLFLMGAGEGGVSPTRDLRAFLERLTSSLHLLPVGAFVQLGRAAICVHCLLWFALSSCAILYWYLNPVSLKKATGGLLLKKEQ